MRRTKMIMKIQKLVVILSLMVPMVASANFISFNPDSYTGDPGDQINVSVDYDFTDFAMFGGGFNVIYDAGILQFISYTQADLSATQAEILASPIGSLASPGNYLAAGIGTFNFFIGMTDAGTIGTFVFELLSDIGNGGTPCGLMLCLTPALFNPMTSLVGDDVTTDVFASGTTAANVNVSSGTVKVPEPGTLALLGIGLAGMGLARRRRKA